MGPEVYNSDNFVTLDFEIDTSHGDYGHPVHPMNSILLSSFAVGHGEVQSIWGDEYSQAKLLTKIEAADILVCHNAKYELGWLKRVGLDLSTVTVFDTQIAEYVLMGNLASGDETMAPRGISLNDCVLRRGGKAKDPVVDKLIKSGVNPKEIPKPWLQGRCEVDVLETRELMLKQRRALRNTGRLPALFTRCQLTPFLAMTEYKGMCLDEERVLKTHAEYTKRMAELDTALEEFTGGINWKSPQQMAKYLYEDLGFQRPRRPGGALIETKSGNPPTDKKTLDKLRASTSEQKTFLKLRAEAGKVNAALTKNLEFFKLVCDRQQGIFNATFNQCNTATHRLSSSGIPLEDGKKRRSVQFQNLPNAFKPLFKARRPGWVMAEADGSQLEFRVAAQLTRDPQACADILDPDFDAHCTSAAVMRKTDYAEFLEMYRSGDKKYKEWRRLAKPDTFGPLFGKSSGSDRLKAWIEEFWKRYHVMHDVQMKNVYTVLETKKLVTPWGLRFYWPYARMSRTGYVNVQRAVFNYWIQSFATAEIIPIAIENYWRRVKEEDLESVIIPVNTVHDSVISEVAEEALPAWKRICIDAFTTDVYKYLERVYNYEFDLVPLGVGLSYGSHWSDETNTEEEYNIFRDGTRQRVT